ncbi:hypothetical protein [Listeria booriae]|uniref:hypothetical protein n=1 Tax=Listeria booriae TaxID=1552123 RepID=UPI0021ADC4C5|nr:hypothetical protein [Listeria booriae]
MDTLFNNNLFFVYLFACIAIVNYSAMLIYFRENMQKNPDIKLLLEFGVEPISISMSFISIIIFVICVNKITAQKFKLKSIDTVITDYFSTNPIYKRPHADFDFLFLKCLVIWRIGLISKGKKLIVFCRLNLLLSRGVN